jgi:uncharacterized protein (TIGR02996 family)
MTDEAFLEAILEAMDDDTPRLVYADWLEDQGQPQRAEFIRVQIELTHLDKDDPRRPALAERQRALLEAHESAWVELAAAAVLDGQCDPRAELLRLRVQRQRLEPHDPRRPELAQRWAELLAELDAEGFGTIAKEGRQAGLFLRERTWRRGFIESAVIERDMLRCGAGVDALCGVTRLRELRVDYIDVGGESWGSLEGDEALLKLPWGLNDMRLWRLSLAGIYLHDPAVIRFVADSGPYLKELTLLDLNGTFVGDDAVRALAACPHLANLQLLDLQFAPLSDAALEALAGSPYLKKLRHVIVGGANDTITPAGHRLLDERFGS